MGRSAIGLRAQVVKFAHAACVSWRNRSTRERLVCRLVLDLRLYRVTLLPFALGLIIVAFSLHAVPVARCRARSPRFDAAARSRRCSQRPAAIPRPARRPTTALAQQIAYAPASATLAGLADADFQVRLVRERVTTAAGTRTIDVGDREPRRHRAGRSP